MDTQVEKVDWKKPALAGAAAVALSLLVPTIVISMYAIFLAIAGQGAPDAARLNRFANLVNGWGSQIVVTPATLCAAFLVARASGKTPRLIGVITGLTAGAASLIIADAFAGSPSMRNVVVSALEIFAGLLGGLLGGWIGERFSARKPGGAFGKIIVKSSPAPVAESDEPAVIVENLRKSYGELRAVDGVSFEARRGEVFGLLGPNGAGKTTTVEIIEGLRRQDDGKVRVCGFDPKTQAREVKQRIGVGMQTTALPDQIKTREALELFASFYRWRVDVDELLATVSLVEKAESRYCNLSGGQRQRLAIALALVNDPAVVILDEPTAGLDPQSRRELHGVIARMRDRGRTVILTTHYIEEAEKLCDRVAIIDQGRIIALDSPHELIARARSHSRAESNAAAPIVSSLEDVFIELTGRNIRE